MEEMGLSSIRYLKNLNVLIGDCSNARLSEQISRHPFTECAEPDIRIKIDEPTLNTNAQINGSPPWGVRAIQAPLVWPVSQGEGVKIAIVDTGVCKEHPALRESYKGGVNVLSPHVEQEDYNGHGTHVAATVAGKAPELGIMGVAPKAHIYGVKTFDRNGSARLSTLLAAIDWCIGNKMNIINMSFGMDHHSETLYMAVNALRKKGIIMIAASGNQGFKGNIDYPAKYPNTIGVCSVSANKNLSVFNNMGDGVDIAAPGDRIYSACLYQSSKEMSGTSMAVPHVVGAIALLLKVDKSLGVDQAKEILVKSADPIKSTDSMLNIGCLNAYNAIKYYQEHL
jgi:subtilisin family serine protease